jgi:putative nucleotidyltransferase with HDIG domain
MPDSGGILLISDWPDRGKELAVRLGSLRACRLVGTEQKPSIAGSPIAIVLDVDFARPNGIERVREHLSAHRQSATPIIALLRSETHLQHVQASALGASTVFPAAASYGEMTAGIGRIIACEPANTGAATAAIPATPAENLQQARSQFGTIFSSAGSGETIERVVVEQATDSVVAAISEGGIREWLDIVWTYDDATYQHCMLVTGLAAAFARSLRFADRDQKHLVRGALLHDVGKAKIPLAILNKPGRLTDEELVVMRTHAQAGYDLLREQGQYEPELLEVVLRHHELLDGSGYPGRLSGVQINDLVRLVTICDIYAALIERRPYKQPMAPARAFSILQEMGEKLETALVRAFAGVAESSSVPAAA